MKIEKINDNQIRCTLNKQDLAARQIKLSEFAYGSKKARDLFMDMMQQASIEHGFEVDDQPLMIEAIPISPESIILNISKVSNPDELDTRFSRFSPVAEEEDVEGFDEDMESIDGADDVLGYYSEEDDDDEQDGFITLGEMLSNKIAEKIAQRQRNSEAELEQELLLIYMFDRLSALERVSGVLRDIYKGVNTLYKDEQNGSYYLVINKSKHTPEEFNKISNILAEYGIRETGLVSREAFFKEHYTLMIKNNALQVLSTIA